MFGVLLEHLHCCLLVLSSLRTFADVGIEVRICAKARRVLHRLVLNFFLMGELVEYRNKNHKSCISLKNKKIHKAFPKIRNGSLRLKALNERGRENLQLLANMSSYLRNGAKYGQRYCQSLIRSHSRAVDWHRNNDFG